MNTDYINFKKMLRYFVHIMRANNPDNSEQFKPGEPKSGQGHSNHRIRQSYETFNHFSIGVAMDVNITAGFQLFQKTCYIHWRDTRCNIRAIANEDHSDFVVLQLWDDSRLKFVGKQYSISDLGLDLDEPNQTLKNFYDQFVDLLRQSGYLRRIEMKTDNLAKKLKNDYNMILRGAPGTGKTYLAHQLAAEMVSNGETDDYSKLTDGQLQRVGFVQFHPSYDYTDFVAGLRPVSDGGQIKFELKQGTFSDFCKKARDHEQDELKASYDAAFKMAYDELCKKIDNDKGFTISGQTIKSNESEKSDYTFTDLKVEDGDITGGVGLAYKDATSRNSYSLGNIQLYSQKESGWTFGTEILKGYLDKQIGSDAFIDEHYADLVKDKYVFIIDEINRGEISKIFGELFFSIDPEYRGKSGKVTTQYANLEKGDEQFYVPKNVYIIGTMNDIDRSVDTFDFAMRRRFNFVEVTAKDSQKMLKTQAVKDRMDRVNKALVSDEIGLTSDYQIGASYFKTLEESKTADELWNEKLKPLFQDYFRGERHCETMLDDLSAAYWGNNDDSN